MSEWFVIKDKDQLIESTRILVFNSMGNEESNVKLTISPEDKEELDTILSFNETKNIMMPHLRKQRNRRTKEERYLLEDSKYQEIIELIGSRMVSNILHGLVKKGLVESAFDTECNDFIFWIPDLAKGSESDENKQSETD
jgi:hypothetical protein